MTDSLDLHIEGGVALDAFGVLVAHGRFSVSLGEVTDAGPDTLFDTADDVTYQAMVLELGGGDAGHGSGRGVYRCWRRAG